MPGWDFSGQVVAYAKIELSDLIKITPAEQEFEPKAPDSYLLHATCSEALMSNDHSHIPCGSKEGRSLPVRGLENTVGTKQVLGRVL